METLLIVVSDCLLADGSQDSTVEQRYGVLVSAKLNYSHNFNASAVSVVIFNIKPLAR